MHEERDLIQNIVQPTVNKAMKEQGEYVSFIDLRWGIDTMSDVTERKILDSCFDEIESCKPYFIVFIGGRYGWIPSDEILYPYSNRFGDVDILGKSITELEILYALKLNTENISRCLFYFKDDVIYENEEVKERIDLLKKKIEIIASSQIKHYKFSDAQNSKNDLSNLIITDICSILETNEVLHWHERVDNQIKSKIYTSLPHITSRWLDELRNGTSDLAVLLYPDCRIKESAIINFTKYLTSNRPSNNIIKRLFGSNNREIYSIYLNVGVSKQLNTIKDLLKYLILKLSEELSDTQLDRSSVHKLKQLLISQIENHTKNGNELYIIISEYDKLIDAHNINWLPDYIKNVKWVISASDKSVVDCLPSLTHKKCVYGDYHLGGIPFDKQISAYENWLGKTIPANVKEAIRQLPYGNDYMMLEIIINRLMHFDGKDLPTGDTKDIPEHMQMYVNNAPHNNREAVRYFLKGDFEKFDPKLCEFIFVCMAFFNKGLGVSDIEKIAQRINLPWTELAIIRILNYESFILTQYEDGRYDISSSFICNSLTKLYHQTFKFEYSEPIYEYLYELPNEVSLKIDNFWFLSFLTNHFIEYIDYLKDLYEVRKDNADLKAAFLPLFSNSEAVGWLFNSFRNELLQYDSTAFITELISIVANTFSNYTPQLTEKFIESTRNIEDLKGNLETFFHKQYILALDKEKNHDYDGFIESFNICLTLSESQFKKNPPQLKFLDEDVEHKFPIGSFQDMLAAEYGFSFVEEVAALMSKYGDLPKGYQDDSKVSYYADKAKEIRAKISRVTYILPEDIEKTKGNHVKTDDVARQTPSLLRGRAVELSKQSDREENVENKIKFLKEAVDIFNKILSMPEDDLTGKFKDSQKLMGYESAIYMECHRDLAISYEKLADLQEGYEKYISLEKAYQHISIYQKEKRNQQTLRDLLNITKEIIPLSLQYVDESVSLDYCLAGYAAFAESFPNERTFSFEERLIANYYYDPLVLNIKEITSKNPEIRKTCLQIIKDNINMYQSLGNIDAMIWMVVCLNNCLTYYVNKLNLTEYISEHIALMGSALQRLEEYLHVDIINQIHENTKAYFSYFLSDEDILSLLHIEKMYSQYMITQGEFDKSIEASQRVIDYCENNKHWKEFSKMTDVEFQARKLYSAAYLELNDIGKAWETIDNIVNYSELLFNKEPCLGNLTELANAKLNQVILWDKMSVEPGLDLWTMEHHKDEDAKKQLFDTYMLCYNFEGRDEELCKLMRRIRQSHEIIKERGLGYLATPKALELVKHFKTMTNNAVQAEKEGRHTECVEIFEKLVRCMHNTHFVDIYFDPDWYAGILSVLGQDAWNIESKDKAEEYYKEAVQLRQELDSEGIGQNKENYATVLYFYALLILNKPLSTESISHVVNLLNKSQKLFKKIENQLTSDSLNYYASCCFNFGQILCLYTSGGNKVGLPFIETSINIMERLVNNYGQAKYEKDLKQFRRQYLALKNR